ncbi:zinc finger protein 185 [Poecilia latipinna]|uniref:zinc finger protein 185 n=1 Tax=Poecilia latipinna TaxID=48699 RepID=UPI00072EC22C|nr:PREDICTED: zinc finger protein 185-like [Poecilia latipinna]XP_014897527.1 PREDICTED: zinc finger protein 185-like [Poecilia latipinna]XP_014897528.1 PREDICTED: zinc finger protein 185-like [Poecilia latipinna]XP_014897529.1 PREDICTED: zinc finger protein 185-like [Poecilia latipinna]
MSKDIDRNQVLQNIRVRKATRKDGWWIHGSNNDMVVSETKQEPAPATNNSLVQSRIKRFQLPANQTNNEADSIKPDDSTEETRKNTTRNTKCQSPSKQAQEQQPVINTNNEKKEVELKAPAGESNVEQNGGDVKVSADVKNEEQIQPASSTNGNGDAAEPPPAHKTAEVKEQNPDTDPTNVEDQVSSDLWVKSGATGTAEIPATPQEALIETDTSSLEDGGETASTQTTEESREKSPLPAEEIVPAASPFIVKELPENTATPDEHIPPQASVEPNVQFESVSKSPAQPGNETPAEASCEKHPPEQVDNETVEAEAEPEVETPDVDNATPREEAPPLNSVQPVACSLPESHDEIQAADSIVVEQSVEPSFGDEVHSLDLNIEDALKPVPSADPEAVQDSSDFRPIDLTDALHVEAPQKESVPKTEAEEQPRREEPDPQPDDARVSEGLQKPAEELNSTQLPKISSDGTPFCSYCNKIIDGRVKIILNEPPVVCHEECLKCDVCAKALGEMPITMFLLGKVIHCLDCFANALNF